jgi:hypothetical protein
MFFITPRFDAVEVASLFFWDDPPPEGCGARGLRKRD